MYLRETQDMGLNLNFKKIMFNMIYTQNRHSSYLKDGLLLF